MPAIPNAEPARTPTHPRPVVAWSAVITLAVAVFAVTATEMLPVGVLPGIGADLGVSTGAAGMSVTAFGVIAGLSAPAMTSWTRRLDRRILLVSILGVFIIGNLATAIVTNYALLLGIRAGIGLMHGLLWSIVASIAVRLVPPASSAKAVAVVFSGISLALVLGVPAGTAVGAWWGWRAAFAALAVLAALTWMAVAVLMPPLPAPPSSRIGTPLARLASGRAIATVLMVTALVVVGNYAAYTYISTFLTDRAGVPSTQVGVYLLVYGVAGVIGNALAGLGVGRTRSLRMVLLFVVLVVTVSLLMLPIVPTAVIVVVIAVWGASYSTLPVVLQSSIFAVAAEAREAATSQYVMVFNIAIAAGAAAGAVALNAYGPCAPALLGSVLCAAAAITVLGLPRHRVGS